MIKTECKNVTVVGLARSGVGAANLLSELGANVTVTDIKTEKELKDFMPKLNPSVKLFLGSHPEDIFVEADMVVISPGVSLGIPALLSAKSKGIPIIGELELAYQIATSSESLMISPHTSLGKVNKLGFLGVTGTNGKSTTTALLDFMMKKSGFMTILGGNIGNALTEEIYELRAKSRGQQVDYIVAEISSFQLESIMDFRPKVAAIVNITPDHLDRYHSLKEYSNAKARIFENQKENDFLVLNRDDPETMKLYNAISLGRSRMQNAKLPKVYFFSRREKVEGLYARDDRIYCNLSAVPVIHYPAGKSGAITSPPSCPFPLIMTDEIKIKGVHNLENAMAASAMALLAGCPAEAVMNSLKEFSGLEHRLEFVREIDGVAYFNDSKGTNVGAVMKSLESFSSPIILIAGGRDKAGDFSLLRKLVRERVKAVVLIGEASQKIKKALGDVAATIMAGDLRDALYISKNMALKGDVVLLSPACASFDMFANFEDRGRQFKQIVMEMQ